MLGAGIVPLVFAVHSMTDVWRGARRPWPVSLLWDKDPRLAEAMIAAFRRDPALIVGDNEPYDGSLKGDTLYQHGTLRGLPHVLIEIRQDLIASEDAAQGFALRLKTILDLALDDMHRQG